MAHTATVLKVMIASPGDVAPERLIAQSVIHDWNAVHSTDRGTVMLPITWETHASPAMGARAQEIINGQLVKDSDLLVAIFWTRIGTPTGQAASGTVEEIEEHLKTGKPVMLYFSMAPVRLDSVDEEQYRALREFKASARKRGLVDEYESLEQFREKFSRQLAQTIIRRFPFRPPVLSGNVESSGSHLTKSDGGDSVTHDREHAVPFVPTGVPGPEIHTTTIEKDGTTTTGHGWSRDEANKDAGDKYSRGETDKNAGERYSRGENDKDVGDYVKKGGNDYSQGWRSGQEGEATKGGYWPSSRDENFSSVAVNNIKRSVPVDDRELIDGFSDEARQLLREAAKDRNGTVLMVETMGGMSVETNEKNFVERGSPRSEARWRRAVGDLVQRGLLEQRDAQGQVFSITDEGFRLADLVEHV